ncbi:Lin0512 family protein [Amaricoccus tamworthensis]|uniref:Lin0512 family protein n=1 Tax=Amaricoccus tamworthensis TaxID=57002 RepID=UPI003C7C7612
MTLKSMVIEFGTGVDIRGGDYTKAAVRAVSAAIRHNTILFADAFGLERTQMRIRVDIGVTKPEEVVREDVVAVFPYGMVDVRVVEGGMEIPTDDGTGITTMANAAVSVFLDLPDGETEDAA